LGARETTAASLPFHLAVGQEAPRDTARAPRLAVGPSTHAGLALVPDKDGAGLDLLPLLLGEPALNTRQLANPTGLEQNDGIVGGPDVSGVGLHGGHVTMGRESNGESEEKRAREQLSALGLGEREGPGRREGVDGRCFVPDKLISAG
jgi:hypothetical protein